MTTSLTDPFTVVSGANAGTYFYAYDGNGNVIALTKASDGTIVAQYEYGPFGELIRATGPLAFVNPFRFSTKFEDDETGFLYYGYRYYNANTGRWLTRDPIGINGGPNEYALFGNDMLDRLDLLGLIDPDSQLPENMFSTVCAKADDLSRRIANLKSGTGDEFKRLFMGTQLCILNKLCKGACCKNDKSAAWLNNTVDTFMSQFTDALDGNFYDNNQRWKKLLSNIDKMKPLGKSIWDFAYPGAGGRREESSVPMYSAFLFEYADGAEIARQMAFTHIDQDLRQALTKNGVGNDRDWKCIGSVVSDCQKQFFDKLERLIGKMLPKDKYDIPWIRDQMREELKETLHKPNVLLIP